ncbi:ATP synthase subunit alpha, mitochondrial, partial [Puccinia sorghi]
VSCIFEGEWSHKLISNPKTVHSMCLKLEAENFGVTIFVSDWLIKEGDHQANWPNSAPCNFHNSMTSLLVGLLIFGNLKLLFNSYFAPGQPYSSLSSL